MFDSENPEITIHSKIAFYPLRYSTESDRLHKYVIVRLDTDETITTTEETFKIIQLLASGKTIHRVANILQLDEKSTLKVAKFLQNIGYIKSINHHSLPEGSDKIHPWFRDIKRSWIEWVIAKPFLFFIFVFICFGSYLGITQPGLLPTYRDLFWNDDIFVIYTVNFIIGLCLIFMHEFMHFITTKAVGGEARIKFSHRFIFPVIETTEYHLALVSKTKRFLVYLSGMLLDALVVSVCFLLLWLDINNIVLPGIFRPIIRVIILLNLYGLLWQFSAYLETDVYNFLQDYLNQDSLYIDTKRYIYLRFRKLNIYFSVLKPFYFIFRKLFINKDVTEHTNDLRTFIERKRKHLMIYSVVLISGLTISFLTFLSIALPRDLEYLRRGLVELVAGFYGHSLFSLIKSVVILFLVIHPYIIVLYSMSKKTKKYESII